MKEIRLSQGFVALVDDADASKLAALRWFAVRHGRRMVAAANIPDPARPGRRTTVLMHRLILGAGTGETVDHRRHFTNEKKIDNRRENLRFASSSQNNANSRRKAGRVSSFFKGVSWYAREKKWRAQIHVNGRNLHLGHFEIEAHAAYVYDLAAVNSFGEFALTNFPVPGSEQNLFGGAR